MVPGIIYFKKNGGSQQPLHPSRSTPQVQKVVSSLDQGLALLCLGAVIDAMLNSIRSVVNIHTHFCQGYLNLTPLPPSRYIDKPLLLDGKKFDVRSYLLIACTVPYMLFFGHGYVRLTCLNYDPMSDDLTSHLTNQVS